MATFDKANKECFRPEGFDQNRPHSIRSLQLDQKARPLSFRPEKFVLFTATLSIAGTYGNEKQSKVFYLQITQGSK